MTVTNEKVAELLDLVAQYVDEQQGEKQAAENEARETRISKIAENYELSTGEAIPETMRNKLGNLDQDTLDHLLKIANNTHESPDSLGGPAEIEDNPVPRTVKEAASHAEQSFLNWIIND